MQNLLWSVEGKDFGDEDSRALGKKVYGVFAESLKDIGRIKSIELLPSNGDENTCPIIEQDGHIGIKKWAVPLIFKHAYKRLFGPGAKQDKDSLTRCVVLCCPDCTTAWNIRKKSFSENGGFQPYDEEFSLTRLTLQLHPKSSESFAHRRWVVGKLTELYVCNISNMVAEQGVHEGKLTPEMQSEGALPQTEDPKVIEIGGTVNSPSEKVVKNTRRASGASGGRDLGNALHCELGKLFAMVRNEFSVCKLAGEKQKCNYNAWAHRSWTVDKIIECTKCLCKQLHNPASTSINECQKRQIHHETCDKTGSEDKDFVNGLLEAVYHEFFGFIRQDWKDFSQFSEKHISDISVLNAVLLCQLCITELATVMLRILRPDSSKQVLENVSKIWEESLEQNSMLLKLYDAHEALWCHRRNIIIAFRKKVAIHLHETGRFSSVMSRFSCESEAEFCGTFANQHAKDLACPQRAYLDRHFKFCNKFLI